MFQTMTYLNFTSLLSFASDPHNNYDPIDWSEHVQLVILVIGKGVNML
jgi:hypothetical protein